MLPAVGWSHALDHLATTDDIGPNKVPHQGVSHILVIPSRVGVSSYPASELEELQSFYDPEGGPGTFRTFWSVVSDGRYDAVPTLVDPVLYTDRCPIPGRDLSNCRFSLDDITLLLNGDVQDTFVDLLERVRDEQHFDLAYFDVNGDGGDPDGYFDGVIVHTDMYSGVGLPLAVFGGPAVVGATSDSDPREVAAGNVALAPPEHHEFGHILGFIDLYGGPTLNGLMAARQATLSAYSRQQIGWSEVIPVTGSGPHDLAPVLDGGSILRFGDAPRYVLVANRGGGHHDALEYANSGLWTSSIDEEALPVGPLGFLDLAEQDLYLPNAEPPYLNVHLPVGCDEHTSNTLDGCALDAPGRYVGLVHASGEHTGFAIELESVASDGTISLFVHADDESDGLVNPGEDPDSVTDATACGCAAPGGGPPTALSFLAVLVAAGARRRHIPQVAT
ncbi:MAG: hypothetical protein JRJ84_10525 [Deltaproteobacteria bacterium]|nr:hypothetical protein [Deltaproteobacteria bacterium]